MIEPTTNASVLMIEDDARLARLTARYLEHHGVRVAIRGDGIDGEAEGIRGRYDCIVLDVQLPRRNGIDVCRGLRAATDVAIVMLSAYSDEETRVSGLDAGADDFVTKPFSARELLARIRAIVRRARGEISASLAIVHAGALTLDTQSLGVTHLGRRIRVTPREFAVLRALAERAGTVVTREQLLELAMGSAELAFDRAIDCIVSRLRGKLGDDARVPRHLKTVRGGGYMLVP